MGNEDSAANAMPEGIHFACTTIYANKRNHCFRARAVLLQVPKISPGGPAFSDTDSHWLCGVLVLGSAKS
jgi:hypothetical protein